MSSSPKVEKNTFYAEFTALQREQYREALEKAYRQYQESDVLTYDEAVDDVKSRMRYYEAFCKRYHEDNRKSAASCVARTIRICPQLSE